MRRRASALVLAGATVVGAATAAQASAPPVSAQAVKPSALVTASSSPCAETRKLGTTVKGRAIYACRRGAADGTPYLAVGQIHGDEPAGLTLMNRLRGVKVPAGVTLWIISTVNPDGYAARTRGNAHKVDLNRNFPVGWKPSTKGSRYYSGPKPFSERESILLARFSKSIRPRTVTVFHQPLNVNDCSSKNTSVPKYFAKASSTRYACIGGNRVGVYTAWFNQELFGTAFTYEFAASNSAARYTRVQNAVVQTAAWRRDVRVALMVHTPVGSTTNISGEVFTVRNNRTVALNLNGWSVKVNGGVRIPLPRVLVPAGGLLKVHTGIGTNTPADAYLGRKAPLWNHSGSVAIYSPSVTVTDACTWSTTGYSARC